jgi:hypothetical protein
MFRIFQQSSAVNACLHAVVAFGTWTQIVSAGEGPEPWPAKVRELPGEIPASLAWGGFHIAVRALPATDGREEAAPQYRFSIRNVSTGVVTTFLAPSAQGSLLERFGGQLQFELWTRGGAGSWSRHLYRFAGAQYRCVRIDEFTETSPANKENGFAAKVPGRLEEVYFVETHAPQPVTTAR